MGGTGFSLDGKNKTKISQGNAENENYSLRAFCLENFKVFQHTDWIKINNLTLVLGDNSSGKSALYQILQMVKTSYEKLKQEIYFNDLSGVADTVGDFSDLCNKSAAEPMLVIGFQFVSEIDKNKILEYYVHIKRTDHSAFGMISQVWLKLDKKAWNLLNFYDIKNLFFLERKTNEEVLPQIREGVRSIMSALRDFAETFQMISACRKGPLRQMQLTGTKPERIGETGYDTYNLLFALSELENQSVVDVNEWMEKFGYSYEWKMYGANRGEFMLCNIKTGVESNIVDNGFGISQSLPLAVAIQVFDGGVILIDSPEAFLQTRMQSEMGDLLVKGAQKGRLFIETGSEYLTLRIQRRVAEGKISAENISLYFIEDDETGNSCCREIGISETGEFQNVSQKFMNFYSSDYYDIEKIDEIRRQKYKREGKTNAAGDSN